MTTSNPSLVGDSGLGTLAASGLLLAGLMGCSRAMAPDDIGPSPDRDHTLRPIAETRPPDQSAADGNIGTNSSEDAAAAIADPAAPRVEGQGIPTGPLVIDDDRHLAWLALTLDGSSHALHAYRTHDGRLAAAHSLDRPLRMLGRSKDGRELLLLDDRGAILRFDVATMRLGEASDFTVPYPPPEQDFGAFSVTVAPEPALHQPTGHVLAITDEGLVLVDIATGAIRRSVAIPVPSGSVIERAALSDDARFAYVAIHTFDVTNWEGHPGTVMMAIDTDSGAVLERQGVEGSLEEWLAGRDRVVASFTVHKGIGLQHQLWRAGSRVREVSESSVRWLEAHPSGDLVYGIAPWYRQFMPRVATLIVADADHLGHRGYVALADSFLWEGSEGAVALHNDADWWAYSSGSDRLLVWGGDPNRLAAIAIAPGQAHGRLAAHPLPDSAEIWEDPIPGISRRTGWPLVLAGRSRIPLAGPPAPDSSPTSYAHVDTISWNSGRSWHTFEGTWPHSVVAASATDEGSVLFGSLSGIGTLRSSNGGRSWLPANTGLASREVMEIAPSPLFATDRTVFATTFEGILERETEPGLDAPATTWVSEDAGQTWAPIGRYAALAVSPHFAKDDRVLAFDYLGPTFFVSHNRGRSWQQRGRLPSELSYGPYATRLWVLPASTEHNEVLLALATSDTGIGGGPHWPESGVRLYISRDQGTTWHESWPGSGIPSQIHAVPFIGIHLFGPIGGSAETRTWLLDVDGQVLLRCDDQGGTWAEVHVPGTLQDPYRSAGRLVAAEPAGDLWFSAKLQDGFERIQTHVDKLLPGPPPPAGGR